MDVGVIFANKPMLKSLSKSAKSKRFIEERIFTFVGCENVYLKDSRRSHWIVIEGQ
jgi:hypothetical protein